jgi:predicted amidohydrolase YtcJ
MTEHADLLLLNARVLTLEAERPVAGAVAISGEIIQAVGSPSELEGLRGPDTRVIDGQGNTLLPGLIDAHCHLLALASSLAGLDCGPPGVGSIGDLQQQVRSQAQNLAPGNWIRGFGYDQLALAEGRHLTRWDLDQAAPAHPVRLDHRGGHASVLNSLALEIAGISRETVDPVDGVIERDASGEPTGLLLELGGFLRNRLGAAPEPEQSAERLRRLNQKLLSCGLTSVQDAGPDNDLARWEVFQEIIRSGQLDCRVTMLAGARYLPEFAAAGLGWGTGDDRLRLGHAKVMLTLTTGVLQPGGDELAQLIRQSHLAGFPVAIHAIEEEAVAAAARAISQAGEISTAPNSVRNPGRNSGRVRDRIEHCAECPDDLIELVRRSGAMVVTQPGFLYWNGEAYRERVEPALLPYLYPLRLLHGSGVPLAFGSDAPVIDPSPWPGLYSAATRTTRQDRSLPEGGGGSEDFLEQFSIWEALRIYCLGGAYAEAREAEKGTIRAGKLADLTLVDWDPTQEFLDGLPDTRALLTIVGGRVVWEA